ncbi:MAG: hypothetical protein ACOYKC_09180 [Anaerolineaceae bacterium]|jgi:hypothetical protein
MIDAAIQEFIADLLAWSLVVISIAFTTMNIRAFRRNPKSEFRAYWIVQCFPLAYLTWAYLDAALAHDRIGVIDGRSAVLLILAVGLMERITHIRRRDERN